MVRFIHSFIPNIKLWSVGERENETMSTVNPISVPEKEVEEKKQKKEAGEKKRKRPKPEPCKCKATVRHINTFLNDLQEVAVEKIYNFPELGGKVVELLEKAVRNEIYYPLTLIENQLVKEEKLGQRDQLDKLEKSRFCKARIHCDLDDLPTLNDFGYESDSDDEANRLYKYPDLPSTYGR